MMQVETGDRLSERLNPGNPSSRLDEAILHAQSYLLGKQAAAGYWLGVLEADASVAAGYIPVMHFMGVDIDPARVTKITTYTRQRQNPDGSWSNHPGGAGDINVSIQVYFAMKLAGVAADESFMHNACQFILDQGGVSKSSVFTRIWLALFGQYPWQGTPSVPPEIILLPNGFYFNIYEFASWSRATIMALSVVLTRKLVCQVPATAGVNELYVEPPGIRDYSLGRIENLMSWKSLFLLADRLLKLWDRFPFHPFREKALRQVEAWIVEHQEADGGWGGIMLPWIYSLFALKSLGYRLDHPVLKKALDGMEGFVIEDDEEMLLQPAVSPVWDTAWSVLALIDSGLAADHPALLQAAEWLLSQEILRTGDWWVKNPHTQPGGWAFEFNNQWYPDLDDTPLVCRALRRVCLGSERKKACFEAIDRALRWTLDMQSRDGGWAAFDRDNNKELLNHIPFADFMSPLDPTCPDVTAHVIELLAELGETGVNFQKALDYLDKTQEEDGAWFGRWGVNYLYGTGLVLAGFEVAERNGAGKVEQDRIRKAVQWLCSHQNADGGWGETPQTYPDPKLRGQGSSTASQTAWALIGLIAAGDAHHQATRSGIEYLMSTQQPDGSWNEKAFTGTGFPGVFYLRYELYSAYFPLIALSKYCSQATTKDTKEII